MAVIATMGQIDIRTNESDMVWESVASCLIKHINQLYDENDWRLMVIGYDCQNDIRIMIECILLEDATCRLSKDEKCFKQVNCL